ncbi:putative NADH:ubiquinone reductase (H(+)-translocating) [Helianthus debilis subsp. tardiflorus]
MDQSRGSAASSNSLSAPLHFLCWTGRCESGRPSHHAKFKPRRRGIENREKSPVVMSEFAPICIYLVISPLVSLIPLGVPFPFASNSSTYPEKLSAYECGFDPFGDARSRFDIRFYLVSILFIIPDPEVTFSFPWAVPLNKIDPFGSWSMMPFLLILTIGSLYEWKRGASDRE